MKGFFGYADFTRLGLKRGWVKLDSAGNVAIAESILEATPVTKAQLVRAEQVLFKKQGWNREPGNLHIFTIDAGNTDLERRLSTADGVAKWARHYSYDRHTSTQDRHRYRDLEQRARVDVYRVSRAIAEAAA